jgi:septal ring factor EnvC (AmiA/AmiB activator)
VLAGRVVFSRRFSGYGNTILLDHGGHYLSVYARAAVVSVKEGDQVLPGQVIGYSAEQAFDNGPPTVYFEMRRDGRAVDPAQWLMRKAASRREEER